MSGEEMNGTTAEALVKAGDPVAALAALQAEIRANAGDPRRRVFLFQLLAVLGDWDRAIRQLKVAAELDALAVPMAQTYREGIICEVYREKVFAGQKVPLIFGEPAEWVALMIEALAAGAAGRHAAAADLRARAFDVAPAAAGTLNGQPFDWVADADMRLGPLLETVINGKYFWVPFASVAAIRAEDPADLRDAVWTPVTLGLRSGSEVVALIPTRYAGTTTAGSDAEKLARATSWHPLGAAEGADGADGAADADAVWVGRGQRVLATDAGDVALMDLRELIFEGAEAEAAAALAAAADAAASTDAASTDVDGPEAAGGQNG